MEDASRSALTNASEQVVTALNTTTQFAAHPSTVATSGVPIASYVWICTRTTDGLQKGLEGTWLNFQSVMHISERNFMYYNLLN